MGLDALLKQADKIVRDEFSLSLSKSRLTLVPGPEWGYSPAVGVYIPKRHHALAKSDYAHVTSTIFHELYGHGLFYEHSMIGKQYYKDPKEYTTSPVPGFGFEDTNKGNSEGFALWMESLLTRRLLSEEKWKRALRNLAKKYRDWHASFADHHDRVGTLDFLATLGFPVNPTPEGLQEFLRKRYSGNRIHLALQCQLPDGKPRVLVVTEQKDRQDRKDWLVLKELGREEFIARLAIGDRQLSDVIHIAEPLLGDQQLLGKLQQEIYN